MDYGFFALMSRMKYIKRWALMKSNVDENLCEHSMEVAMLSHALCTIGNERYGRHLDANKAAVIGLYHDAAEIITGDMPTPIKYSNSNINSAYRDVESKAEGKLLGNLPEDLKGVYQEIFEYDHEDADEAYMRKLVKAADKLSALIKCISEVGAGNHEFSTARESTEKSIRSLYSELPEVLDFVNEFLSPYGATLDELLL